VPDVLSPVRGVASGFVRDVDGSYNDVKMLFPMPSPCVYCCSGVVSNLSTDSGSELELVSSHDLGRVVVEDPEGEGRGLGVLGFEIPVAETTRS